MRDLALDHVAQRIDDSAYLERLGQFRTDLATMDTTPRGELTAKRAVQWLRVLADTWVNADVPKARADLLHAIYDRIVVKGRSILAARLTPAAYRTAWPALPHVAARPEGFRRTGQQRGWAAGIDAIGSRPLSGEFDDDVAPLVVRLDISMASAIRSSR
jgi:hypothetical protein